jgi:hypothetical protein
MHSLPCLLKEEESGSRLLIFNAHDLFLGLGVEEGFMGLVAYQQKKLFSVSIKKFFP